MKKLRSLFSLVFVVLAAMLTACAKETTIYLTVKSDDGKLPPLGIVAIILGVVFLIAILAFVSISKKKKQAAAEAEAEENAVVLTQDPNAVSEYIFENELKAAEEASEEKPEEASEEKPEEAEEEKAEEEPVEESSEESAEEEKTEEPEEVVEEVADASFDSEPEEKSEEPVEEIAEEAAEETVEEAVEEAPETEEMADVTEEAVEEEPAYTIGANGLPVAPDGMVIRYKWSFLGRLTMADDELKYRYMKLRRKLLSYKKVRSNVSWNFDSYFIGRKPIVKLKVRGKTLVAYFPIDPEEMKGTKYVGEDFSGVSRYKAVPFAYRINGERKLRYAIELIEKQLEGIKSTEPKYIELSQANEAIPRESVKKLYEKGYIRVGGILAVGERASAKDDDEDEEDIVITEDTVEEEVAPSELREVFNFNPKVQ